MSQTKHSAKSPKTNEATLPARSPGTLSAAPTLPKNPAAGPALIVFGYNDNRIPQAALRKRGRDVLAGQIVRQSKPKFVTVSASLNVRHAPHFGRPRVARKCSSAAL